MWKGREGKEEVEKETKKMMYEKGGRRRETKRQGRKERKGKEEAEKGCAEHGGEGQNERRRYNRRLTNV